MTTEVVPMSSSLLRCPPRKRDIKTKSASIFQALRKCPIVTIDIFLFNIGKSKNKFDQINYDMLEGIKDGELSKYDNQRITLNTQNVVMVFSSDEPNTSRLAKDRWKLFFIKNDQLKEHII